MSVLLGAIADDFTGATDLCNTLVRRGMRTVQLIDVRILVTAILVQRDVGGNLAEVLDKIAYVIRQRFTIRRQLRVYTAQGRFSGIVLALLPIAVGSALFFINKPYMITLFFDPIARYFLIMAVILQILGYFWIRKIVDIEI